MTTLLSAEPGTDNIWASMPGWGIVADLTPPELIATRSLRVLRKRLVAGLALIALICAGGYVWGSHKASSAQAQLATSQATTARLAAQNAKYGNVVVLQTTIDSISGQIATLMATDVDVASFVTRVRDAAPAGTTFTSISVALGPSSASTVSTEPVVGTLTMSGTSAKMTDVAGYVDALLGLKGLVNVIPATNSATKPGGRASWAITAQLTDLLYTHRFGPATASAAGTSGGH